MPFAKGVSSFPDGTSHGVADPKLLIDEDLRHQKEIPMNQFVEHMLCYSFGDHIDRRIPEDAWEPTAQFGRVAVWLGPLFRLFRDARNARQNHIFRPQYGRGQTSETLDMETLGGRTTYQTFLHILGDG
ncbi:hypothetical protein BS47DRAFT_1490651 [Hydnum rufescens UP504]|uniref:Uncharacterized protein n=1 Tax=Hydnum rufescens UP504 TaxID=1448309 RepID=A0A9P6AB09_9AGAM|nr:hypothetical protein BS47DRAFT_1490651 [Hydnum rufescens UP504]